MSEDGTAMSEDGTAMTRRAAFDTTITDGADATQTLGASMAAVLRRGDLVALTGDLGAGKTCFVQGLCRALGVTGRVNSPSFILINEYEGVLGGEPLSIRHFDLYRLGGPDELEDIGAREFFHDPDAICLVEWADRVPELLPAACWWLDMSYLEGADAGAHDRRQATCRWISDGVAHKMKGTEA